MNYAATESSQSGFAMVGVLGIMVVLAILGTAVYRNVNTDISHSGRDVNRVRAEFAAESAVQWGLSEVARKRPGKVPFTLATHASDGIGTMEYAGDTHYSDEESGQTTRLTPDQVEFPKGVKGGIDKNGWIFRSTSDPEISVSNAKKEILSFKVWYPDDSTMRIQGRGEVNGSTMNVDLVSRIREVAVPM
jgi:hypothetical protein